MDYSPEVLQRFRSPLRAGNLDPAPSVVCGEAQDRALNIWVRFQLEVADGRIERARFQVFGCPHAVAAADRAAEWLEGRAVGEIENWDAHAVAHALEVPAEKLGKLLRIEDAVLACSREHAANDMEDDSDGHFIDDKCRR
jgi:NifU-like protein involved in Fe-S cluster formation